MQLVMCTHLHGCASACERKKSEKGVEVWTFTEEGPGWGLQLSRRGLQLLPVLVRRSCRLCCLHRGHLHRGRCRLHCHRHRSLPLSACCPIWASGLKTPPPPPSGLAAVAFSVAAPRSPSLQMKQQVSAALQQEWKKCPEGKTRMRGVLAWHPGWSQDKCWWGWRDGTFWKESQSCMAGHLSNWKPSGSKSFLARLLPISWESCHLVTLILWPGILGRCVAKCGWLQMSLMLFNKKRAPFPFNRHSCAVENVCRCRGTNQVEKLCRLCLLSSIPRAIAFIVSCIPFVCACSDKTMKVFYRICISDMEVVWWKRVDRMLYVLPVCNVS